MQSTTAFLVGLGTTVSVSLVAVVYLRNRLKKVLMDLCGTEDRAAFWTTFSNLLLTVIPAIFALHFQPAEGAEGAWVFAMSRQIEYGLVGLAGTVVMIGFVIRKFIPRVFPAKPAA